MLAKGFGRAPAEYAEVARQLGEVGVLDPHVSSRLRLMAGYRNRMVHAYSEITDAELFGILTNQLGVVEPVIGAITAWVDAHPDRVASAD